MENRRNAVVSNLCRTKNENSENTQAKERSHVGNTKVKNFQRSKRVPLGSLSNSCRHPFQTRSKVLIFLFIPFKFVPSVIVSSYIFSINCRYVCITLQLASLHEQCEKNDICAPEKYSRTKLCDGTSHQTFAVYIDQEQVPWPSVDLTVHTTDTGVIG